MKPPSEWEPDAGLVAIICLLVIGVLIAVAIAGDPSGTAVTP